MGDEFEGMEVERDASADSLADTELVREGDAAAEEAAQPRETTQGHTDAEVEGMMREVASSAANAVSGTVTQRLDEIELSVQQATTGTVMLDAAQYDFFAQGIGTSILISLCVCCILSLILGGTVGAAITGHWRSRR